MEGGCTEEPLGVVGSEKMRGAVRRLDFGNSVPTQVSRGSPRKPKVLSSDVVFLPGNCQLNSSRWRRSFQFRRTRALALGGRESESWQVRTCGEVRGWSCGAPGRHLLSLCRGRQGKGQREPLVTSAELQNSLGEGPLLSAGCSAGLPLLFHSDGVAPGCGQGRWQVWWLRLVGG